MYEPAHAPVSSPALVLLPGGPGVGAEIFASPLQPVIASRPSALVDWPIAQELLLAGGEALFDACCRRIEEARQSLGVAQVIPIGHSTGGCLAIEFALRYPQATAGVILLNSSPTLSMDDQDLARMRDRLGTAWPGFERAMSLTIDDEDEWRQCYTDVLGCHLASRDLDDAVRALHGVRLSARAFNMSMAALSGWDVRRQLRELRMPVLVIAGADDWLFPPASSLDGFAELPAGTLSLVPGAGHAGFLDSPETFCRLILDWLKRHG